MGNRTKLGSSCPDNTPRSLEQGPTSGLITDMAADANSMACPFDVPGPNSLGPPVDRAATKAKAVTHPLSALQAASLRRKQWILRRTPLARLLVASLAASNSCPRRHRQRRQQAPHGPAQWPGHGPQGARGTGPGACQLRQAPGQTAIP
jgi:hypothetical protein